MRTIRLRGGLGNQLFGLAFAHSVGTLTGEPVRIDLSAYDRDRYHRAFQTRDLAVDLGVPIGSGRSLRAALRGWLFAGQVVERHPPHDLADLARRGRHFDGYWQNEVYIADPQTVRERTRAFLVAKGGVATVHDIVIHHRSYAEELSPTRRGSASTDYLRRAITFIEGRHGHTGDIVLVSDNPSRAGEWLGDLESRVTILDRGGAFSDMALLLRARSLILANSSFSWWAGYCGDVTTITYPERGDAFHYPEPTRRFTVV